MILNKKINLLFTLILVTAIVFSQMQYNKILANDKIDLKIDYDSNENNGEGAVLLDWSNGYDKNLSYKAYRQKEEEDWEVVSMVDFTNPNQKVKVLNVHPGAGNTHKFKFKDGSEILNHKSASLKVWMEGGISDDLNGGIETFDVAGKGIIEVTPVFIGDFNNNPDSYLIKDSDGNYNYDVIMFGTWDSNMAKDLNDISYKAVDKFMDSGNGVLFGHDTFRGNNPDGTPFPNNVYFNKLASRSGIKIIDDHDPDRYNGSENDVNGGFGAVGGLDRSNIVLDKDGLLTSFPWKIGTTGDSLSVPICHTTGQEVMDTSDIWIRFKHPNYTSQHMNSGMNFYLTVHDNTAMIQTGHSNANATIDESKILANTLFYLKQTSSEKDFKDTLPKDNEAPNKVSNIIYDSNKIKWDISDDNGATYNYKVESYKKTNLKDPFQASEEKKIEIKSGTKGYYYYISDNENDDFNILKGTFTDKTEITISDNMKGKYVSFKAVDNMGNVSDVNSVFINTQSLDFSFKFIDNNNSINSRPNNVSIDIFNGNDVVETINVPVDKSKETTDFTILSLPIVDDNKNEYTYSIKSSNILLKNGDFYEFENNVFTLKGKYKVNLTHTFNDDSNGYLIRPESLSVSLGDINENITVNQSDNNTQYKFPQVLTKYDDSGKILEYNFDIVDISGYDTSFSVNNRDSVIDIISKSEINLTKLDNELLKTGKYPELSFKVDISTSGNPEVLKKSNSDFTTHVILKEMETVVRPQSEEYMNNYTGNIFVGIYKQGSVNFNALKFGKYEVLLPETIDAKDVKSMLDSVQNNGSSKLISEDGKLFLIFERKQIGDAFSALSSKYTYNHWVGYSDSHFNNGYVTY